jgi:hypothetical protein
MKTGSEITKMLLLTPSATALAQPFQSTATTSPTNCVKIAPPTASHALLIREVVLRWEAVFCWLFLTACFSIVLLCIENVTRCSLF